MTLRVSLQDTRRTLLRPVGNAQQQWQERAGCLLRLEGESGLVGVGEASPLPGFSKDEWRDCKQALVGLDLRAVPVRLERGQSVFSELARASGALPSELPAARAALEAALLDLWARSQGRPAWALLLDSEAPRPAPRRVAALLMGEPEQALAEARLAAARQVRSFKFKVGRPGALERELRAVSELRQGLGNEVDLRLDGNRGFAVTQAAALRRFATHELEFIEEPYPASARSSLSALQLPIALDESLAELTPNPSQLRAWKVRAVVLKPTLLGGITGCTAWARAAQAAGADVIVSHAFEGPHGLALSAALALTFGSPERAHGLDLQSARVDGRALPCYVGPEIRAWSAPGFALGQGTP